MSTAKVKDDFFNILEAGVRSVLEDKESTPEQRIQAINAGTKLMQAKYKLSDPDEKEPNFFSKGKK